VLVGGRPEFSDTLPAARGAQNASICAAFEILACWIAGPRRPGFSGTPGPRPSLIEVVDADLRAELLRRKEKDQAARLGGDAGAIWAADAENLPWLKQVIAEHGWPGKSLAGEDGAFAAWLLVQHADGDPAFQRHCLELMTAAADRGEATRRELAYLTDRVLLAEGQPQVYGTQAIGRAGRFAARKLRDPDGVDQRRASAGLGPLAEYLASMLDSYGPPEPLVITCQACGAGVPFWPPDDLAADIDVTVACPACGKTATVTFNTTPHADQ
jgi:Family of unknown function (DUF6624)